MNARLLRIALLLGLVIFLLAGALLPTSLRDSTNIRRVEAKNTITQVVSALEAYQLDNGYLPHGTEAEIMDSLRGNNLRKVFYFEATPKSFNEKGELIDPWQTPYRIDLAAKPHPHVSSAGKNKVFDGDTKDSDDIRSSD